MFRISCMNCLSCQRIFAFDFALRWTYPRPTISPSILSIRIYVQPWRVKAQWTFGAGMEVCWAMKRFGKVSQRAVFDTQPIREKEDVSRSWTELLEESDGGENEKPPQRGVIDGW